MRGFGSGVGVDEVTGSLRKAAVRNERIDGVFYYFLMMCGEVSVYLKINQSIPILIRVYPHKQGWPYLLHPDSNLSNFPSPSCSIQCILLFQTNTPALFLHLHFPCLPRSSSLPLSLQTRMLFSKHAYHPSITHAHIISLHLLLPSEPLIKGTIR